MKNKDFIIFLVVLAIFSFAALFSLGDNAWGSTVAGAIYFHAVVVGAGLFWIGMNLKKK